MLSRQEFSSLRQGLVGAWCPSLGASGLSLIDRSGRNNHGTLTNMGGQSVWNPFAGSPALTLDGSNDYVDFGTAPTCDVFSGNCTVSFWVNANSFGSVLPVFAKGRISVGGFYCTAFSFSSVNYVQFNFSIGATQNDTNCSGLVAGVWYHCAAQLNGSVRSAFVNGSQTDSRAYTPGTSASSSYNLFLGRDGGGTTFFNGRIDDLRVYNRALTLAEIRLLASRRGIGLSPLPDRAAGMPRKISLNVANVWKNCDCYVNDANGVPRLTTPNVNVGGVWK